jgi:DNA-binding transcriptional LysR family regulator
VRRPPRPSGHGVIVGAFPPAPARFAATLLFKEGFLCAARRGHLAMARRLTLAAYLGLGHLHVSLSGEPTGYVDNVLRPHKRRRTVALTVGHFLVAPAILAATDLIATEPARVLRPAAVQWGLDLKPPPLAVPAFDVVQMWPRRLTSDEGAAGLRQQVAAVAAAV